MNTEMANSRPSGKMAGVLAHLTSLPGPYGIGEIGAAARDFIDCLSDMNLRVWQFLPTGPTAYGDSPYQPLSTFAGNEMLIDLDELVALGLLKQSEVCDLQKLPAGYVDYASLIPAKRQLLQLAASRFTKCADAALKAAYDDFLSHSDDAWLHDYAIFRYLKQQYAEQPWQQWDAPFVQRDEKALQRVLDEAGDLINASKILQFLFFHQWQTLRSYARSRDVTLFGDMPIYIALDSADAWTHPELLAMGDDGQPTAVAGVPPDYFAEDGQLWGNPLYNWEAHARDDYQWWVRRLKASMMLADLIRIDHFRGFEAYWTIPAAAESAKSGCWQAGPGDAIFEAMRETLGDLPIVAEDLGIITPEVDALRERHNMPGMSVLQFEVANEHFELQQVAADRVCYTGTHDNDTTLGWFRGSPGDLRSSEEIAATQRAALAKTGGSAETISIDMIRAAFSTNAQLAVAPLQDYLELGSEARFNVPGTSGGNWRWRVTGEQLSYDLRQQVAAMVDAAGRSA